MRSNLEYTYTLGHPGHIHNLQDNMPITNQNGGPVSPQTVKD